MASGNTSTARAGRRWIGLLLFAFALSLLTAVPALAINCVADAGGIIDGFVNYPVPPSQINLDGNCRIQNYPASNPMTSNFSFDGTLRGVLVIFDSVVFTGNMSCDASHQNKLWSVNDLHSIMVVDDLNATGVDLTYVSHTATWLDNGTQVPHTFSNVGNVLTFDNIPIVDAGRQFAINLTVVLNNTPTNVVGKQFINTARWDFGRLIKNVFYQPLPGENGVSPPLTISAPVLVVNKTGPATMNLGQWGNFALDVQNTGSIDAWDVSLRDLFPDGPTGGMCDLAPQIVSARVFAADGVTPVPGKGPLVAGTDYSLTWSGTPQCRLNMTMLTAAARIGPGERLI